MKKDTLYNTDLLPDKASISYDELLKISTHRMIVRWAGSKDKPGFITPLKKGTRLIDQEFLRKDIVGYLSQIGSKKGRPKKVKI